MTMNETRKIKKLPEVVINKIAAGEIVQGPSSVVKELVENSLDAGSTQIIVSIKRGGLDLVQIQDNGCGIVKDDFEILCERFTTSKLTEFKDLLSILTFGFRGEALASMTYVAHVEVISKTADNVCAFKGSFCEGKLQKIPQPCAGNTGTIVKVEDLFYNIPIRQQSLKNSKEELSKIIEVVSNYGILNAHKCSMTLKRIDNNAPSNPDVRIIAGTSVEDSIIEVYGGDLSKQLLPIEYKNDKLGFSIKGQVSKPGYNAKKMNLVLFINNRLVHCELLKKSLDNLYSNILPKKSFPFIFLHLQVPSNNIDVNVHPTKKEVHFLHQELIVAEIQEIIEKYLHMASESRSFSTKSLLNKSSSSVFSASTSFNQSIRPSEKVRVDASLQKINAFFPTDEKIIPHTTEYKSHVQLVSDASVPIINKIEPPFDLINSEFVTPKVSKRNINESKNVYISHDKNELTALNNLRNSIETTNLCDWRNFVYVGMIDKDRILIQRDTELLLVNTPAINYNLFYQLVLHHFGNFGKIDIADTKSKENTKERTLLKDLFVYGLKENEELYKDVNLDCCINVLIDNSEMLEDYFSIKIDTENKTLVSIPIVLEKFIPDLRKLPKFIFNLCTKITWKDEQLCLQHICREIAEFYAYGIGSNNSLFADKKQFESIFENSILPMYRTFLRLPVSFEHDGTLIKLTSLPELYKVFERC